MAKEAVDAGLKVADGREVLSSSSARRRWRRSRARTACSTPSSAPACSVINPGCGACIGCGPGVSDERRQVTVSAINRNYKGRSGPGKLWLASPLTVAASAFTGRITAYTPGMFARAAVEKPVLEPA